MPDGVALGACAPDPAWNETAAPLSDATVIGMIDRAAALAPQAPAIVTHTGATTTFGRLVEDSVMLAAFLAHLGVTRGAYVGILASRSATTITSIVAAARSGAAYVPLDPTWPVQRLVDILVDRSVDVLVTDCATLQLAQTVAWSSSSVSSIVCPDLRARVAWHSSFRGDSISAFFDEMVAEDDLARAAGFGLRSGDEADAAEDFAKYQAHVCTLVRDAAPRPRPRILEIGCGAGTVAAPLAQTAACYTATDPSRASVEKCVALGLGIDAHQCFAHEVGDFISGEYDLCLVASTAQFFPSLDYLLDLVAAMGKLLAPDGVLVLADLPAPEDVGPGLLGIPRAVLLQLPGLIPGVSTVEILERAPGSVGQSLAQRYDAVIHYTADRRLNVERTRGRVYTGAMITECREPLSLTNLPTAQDPAYTIFTSGSTGTPKGVLVSHRSLTNLVEWLNPSFNIRPGDTVLFTTAFGFDLSVYDVFGVLASGACIRLASDNEVADPDLLLNVIRDENITIWDSTPGSFGMVLTMGRNRGDTLLGTLRLVLLSGDWIPVDTPARARSTFGEDCTVVAMGGATECTVWSNVHVAENVDPSWPSIPYGRPIPNARYYVLDEQMRACPADIEGDLYIAGACVALGYVGRPGLTASAFLADPWAPIPGERMYRTGDRACWLPHGEVQFRGRLDDQVKVRGYRIELGEVWSALVGCETVLAGAVLTVPTKIGPVLAAAYVPARPDVSSQQVKEEMAISLPQYMIPDRIVPVEAIPLKSTGKTDRERLLQIIMRHRPNTPLIRTAIPRKQS